MMKTDKSYIIKIARFLTVVTITMNIFYLVGTAAMLIKVKQDFGSPTMSQNDLEKLNNEITKSNNIEKIKAKLIQATKVIKSSYESLESQINLTVGILESALFAFFLNLTTLLMNQVVVKKRT